MQREKLGECHGANRRRPPRLHRHGNLADHGARVEIRDSGTTYEYLHLAVSHEVHLVCDIPFSNDNLTRSVNLSRELVHDELHEFLIRVPQERRLVQHPSQRPHLQLRANVVRDVRQQLFLPVEQARCAFIVEELSHLHPQRHRDLSKLEVLVGHVHQLLKLHIRRVDVGDEPRDLG